MIFYLLYPGLRQSIYGKKQVGIVSIDFVKIGLLIYVQYADTSITILCANAC